MILKIKFNNKTRIIKNIRFQDEKHLEAEYYGWFISIYPMFGKLIGNVYFDNLETGEFGVEVSGKDGLRIVNDVCKTKNLAIKNAVENILLCRPQYQY